MSTYLNATPEAGKTFYLEYKDAGAITMLNLLRFRAEADYSQYEALRPSTPITGRAAYERYLAGIRPCFAQFGSRIIYQGTSAEFLIGPTEERWDMVLLVEHPSVAQFMALAQDAAFLQQAGHRVAAVADSRLLPSVTELLG